MFSACVRSVFKKFRCLPIWSDFEKWDEPRTFQHLLYFSRIQYCYVFFFKLIYLETFLILLYGSCTNRNVILDIKFKPFLFSLTLHLLYKYLVNKRKQYQNNSNGKMKSYFNDFIIRFFCNIKHWQYSQQFLNDLLVMRETKQNLNLYRSGFL